MGGALGEIEMGPETLAAFLALFSCFCFGHACPERQVPPYQGSIGRRALSNACRIEADA
jgi:hypothetical protein